MNATRFLSAFALCILCGCHTLPPSSPHAQSSPAGLWERMWPADRSAADEDSTEKQNGNMAGMALADAQKQDEPVEPKPVIVREYRPDGTYTQVIARPNGLKAESNGNYEVKEDVIIALSDRNAFELLVFKAEKDKLSLRYYFDEDREETMYRRVEQPSVDLNTYDLLPDTVEAAVALLEKRLTKENREDLRNRTEEELVQLHMGFGLWIRNELQLWSPRSPLRYAIAESVDQDDIHPDRASSILIKTLWRKLNAADKPNQPDAPKPAADDEGME